MILINALGCKETGARRVAIELLKAYPTDGPIALVLIADSAADFELPPPLRPLVLRHTLFGRYLRPLTEALINLAITLPCFRLYLNLSHYGLCWFGRHRVYIHSPEMVSDSPAKGISGGKMNAFKAYCFRSCLRRAEHLYVQTDHMRERVSSLSAQNLNGEARPIYKLRPRWEVKIPQEGELKLFPFQFFYPTSPFPHKRPDLAIEGILAAHDRGIQCGLRITVPRSYGKNSDEIDYLGNVSHSRVLAIMRSSDALLFTSEKETLGLPLLEAMAMGVPVIAPQLPYAEEILGDAGLYFTPGSIGDLTNAISTCVQDPKPWSNRIKARLSQMHEESVPWGEHWHVFLSDMHPE